MSVHYVFVFHVCVAFSAFHLGLVGTTWDIVEFVRLSVVHDRLHVQFPAANCRKDMGHVHSRRYSLSCRKRRLVVVGVVVMMMLLPAFSFLPIPFPLRHSFVF